MKAVSLYLVLLLALVSRSESGQADKPLDYSEFPRVVSEQTLNNVVVKTNPTQFLVIVTIDGKTDLRVETKRPIPRKLAYHEYVVLEEDLLFYEKTGKYEKMEVLHSQSGKSFRVPIAAITPLTPTKPQEPARPKPAVSTTEAI